MRVARRPRLPLFLGLAVLTVMAHLLMTAGHLGLHVVLGIPMGAARWALAVGLALAPFFALALMMRGRPRHGAALLALLMAVAAAWLLYEHYVRPGPDALPAMRDQLGGSTYAGVLQMLLAFELQGFAAGVILILRPQAPRDAHQAEVPAS